MNISRAVVIGIAGGALAAWIAAASTSGSRPPLAIAQPRQSVVDKSSAELASEINRLHERLHPDAAPQQPARNLFEFGGRATAAPVASPAMAPAPPQDAPP